MNRSAGNVLLAVLTAAFLVLCFPSYNLFWLAPVALAPLIAAATREARWKRRFLLGYVSGLVYWFWTCNWIHWTIATHGGMSLATAWFVFALFTLAKAIQSGVFALLAGWTMRSRFAVPATAALWVLIEYTHAPLGFAWLQLGNAAIDIGIPMRLAPITGVWGISFLFAVIAGEIANLIGNRRGVSGLSIALIATLFFLPNPPEDPANERAILVQPNIDEEQQWTQQAFSHLLSRMQDLSFTPLRNEPRPSLLIWPEAPAPFYDNDPGFLTYLGNIAKAADIHFVAGLVAHAPDNAALNSAVLIDAHGNLVTRYDKINLVPFGEYIPLGLGPIAFKISNETSDFQPGTRRVVSPLAGHKLATFICYESVFPSFIASFVHDGAQVLINPSNDGWFGKTAARYQHLEIVRMRAAENGRWILRATNDGISAAIDPAGRLRTQLPLYQEASNAVGFSYRSQETFYTAHGDWLVLICLLLALVGFVAGVKVSGTYAGPRS